MRRLTVIRRRQTAHPPLATFLRQVSLVQTETEQLLRYYRYSRNISNGKSISPTADSLVCCINAYYAICIHDMHLCASMDAVTFYVPSSNLLLEFRFLSLAPQKLLNSPLNLQEEE